MRYSWSFRLRLGLPCICVADPVLVVDSCLFLSNDLSEFSDDFKIFYYVFCFQSVYFESPVQQDKTASSKSLFYIFHFLGIFIVYGAGFATINKHYFEVTLFSLNFCAISHRILKIFFRFSQTFYYNLQFYINVFSSPDTEFSSKLYYNPVPSLSFKLYFKPFYVFITESHCETGYYRLYVLQFCLILRPIFVTHPHIFLGNLIIRE